MKNNKVVYLHRRRSDNKVFYVGMGYKKRAFDFIGRNPFWKNYTEKYGLPNVEIVESNLSSQEACSLEVKLIKKYGRRVKGKGSLVNICKGGAVDVSTANEKRLLCLKTGNVYESIKHYCNDNKIAHSTVSSFLNRRDCSRKKDLFVRLVVDNNIQWIPFFDGDESQEIIEHLYQSDNVIKFKTQEQINKIKDRFNNLNLYERVVFYMSIHKSYKEIAKETDFTKDLVFAIVNYVRNILKGYEEPKKISYNIRRFYSKNLLKIQILEKSIKISNSIDKFYFEDILQSLSDK
jgi:predicted GIY-YIG superfamily endonuclease